MKVRYVTTRSFCPTLHIGRAPCAVGLAMHDGSESVSLILPRLAHLYRGSAPVEAGLRFFPNARASRSSFSFIEKKRFFSWHKRKPRKRGSRGTTARKPIPLVSVLRRDININVRISILKEGLNFLVQTKLGSARTDIKKHGFCDIV